MANWCASTAATRILYLRKEAVLQKTHYESSNCSTEVSHRSSWPICYCLEKSNQHTHTRTTTVTLRRIYRWVIIAGFGGFSAHVKMHSDVQGRRVCIFYYGCRSFTALLYAVNVSKFPCTLPEYIDENIP